MLRKPFPRNIPNKRRLSLTVFNILLTGLSLFYLGRYMFMPNTGFIVNYPEITYRDSRIIFSPKAPLSPLEAAGMVPDKDIIRKINGRPVANTHDVVQAVDQISDCSPIPVEVERDGMILTIQIKPDLNLLRYDWIFILLFTALLFFTSYLLTFRYPDNMAYNILSIASMLYALYTNVKPFYYENIVSLSLIHAGTYAVWFLLLFSVYFPAPRFNRKVRTVAIPVVFLLHTVWVIVRLATINGWFESGNEYLLAQFRELGKIINGANFGAYFLFCVILFFTWKQLKKNHEMEEQVQVEYLLFGFLLAISLYALFEELPLIIGEKLGSRINLGNYLNIFLCVLPGLFLVGHFAKKSFSLPKAAIYYFMTVLSILSDMLLFNLFFGDVKAALMKWFGLIQEKADFLTLFLFFAGWIILYLLALQLVKRIRRIKLIPNVHEQFEELQRDYHAITCKAVSMERNFNRQLQTRKSEELYGLFHGIKTEYDKNVLLLDNGLCLLNSGIDELAVISRNVTQGIDAVQSCLDRMRTGFESILKGSMLFKSYFGSLFKAFENRFPVQSYYSVVALVKTAEYTVWKEYDSITIRFDLKATGKIYCAGNELIQAFIYILQNVIDAQTDPFNEIIIRSYDEGTGIIVEIEDFEYDLEEKDGKPPPSPLCNLVHDQRGIRYFICRMYIEKNEGILQYRRKNEGGGVISILFQNTSLKSYEKT